MTSTPHTIRIHPNDNVAVVVNEGGLSIGTALPGGPTLIDTVPQGHKVALTEVPKGGEVRRYGVVIGHAAETISPGAWVNEQRLVMPQACSLDQAPASDPPSDLPG
jgi:galactarate dehydratase